MKAIARYSDSDLTHVTWAIYWRLAIFGFLLAALAGGLVGAATGFVSNVFEGFMYMPVGVSALNQSGLTWLPGVLGWAVGIVANFYVLKWILRSRIGKNIGDSMLLIVAVSNDKDLSNAN